MSIRTNPGAHIGSKHATGTGFKAWLEWNFSRMRKYKISYLFIAPYMIIFLIFTVTPVLMSMFLSFTHFNILEPPKWVGIDNYLRLFLSDDIFTLALQNTFIFAAITGPLSYLMCLIFAWLINELPGKLRSVVTLVFYVPAISGNAYLIWAILFSGDSYGYINGLLIKFGIILEPIQYLTDKKYMMMVVIIAMIWVSLGASFLAFRAGLQGIDRALYDASAIDGVKNRWQELWFVTLPSMKPQLMFGAVMSITASFGTGSIVTALVGFPSTDYACHTIVHHLEDYGGIRFEMGYASAIATLLFVIMIACNLVVKKLISKVGG